MEVTEKFCNTISLPCAPLGDDRQTITDYLEQAFIIKDGNPGRVVAGKINTELTLLGHGMMKTSLNRKRYAEIDVLFEMKSYIFPSSLVLNNCVYVHQQESSYDFSDTGFYEFELSDELPEIIKNKVKIIVESKFLLTSQRQNITKLKLGATVNLKVLGSDSFDQNNVIVCRCMIDDGIIPIFKLSVNAPLQEFGLKKIDETKYYQVKNGVIVEAEKNKDNIDLSTSILNASDLYEYIMLLRKSA